MIKTVLLATAALVRTAVYDPGKAGWKLSADGKTIEMKDGNPIYVNSDGSETVMEGNAISTLNAEARRHREAKETAEAALKKFEKITDPAKALDAIEKLAKIDQKTLIDAGEVDKVRNEISAQFTAQIAERDKEIANRNTTLEQLRRQNAFQGSKFVQERVAVPHDMFMDKFGPNFKDENGQLVGYYPDGNKIMTKDINRLGTPAQFDEALSILIESYPHKESILKAPTHNGSGNGGAGGGRGGSRHVSRADFEKMTPVDQAATAAAAGKGELTIG